MSPGTARPVPGMVITEYSRNFGGADTRWLAPQRATITVNGTTKSSKSRVKVAIVRGRSGLRAISSATSYVETGLGQLHPRKGQTVPGKWFIA